MAELLSKDHINYTVNGADLADITNYNEIMVLECLRARYESDTSLCDCAMCTEDAYALAMNMAPVRYIQISSVKKYRESDNYVDSSIIKAIVDDAVGKIKNNPNHANVI